MQRRQGWLFPLMVVAATSVIAFGAVGIAAITGHPPMPSSANQEPLLTANANAQRPATPNAAATPGAAGQAHAARLPAGEPGRPIVRN